MSFAIRKNILESSAFWLLQRLHWDGENITQAAVSSITWKCWDSSDTLVTSGTLTVSSVVFNTLQTDDKWTLDPYADDEGYNFAHAVPSNVITTPGTYRIEHKFTMATPAGVFIPDYWILTAESLLT